MPSLTSLYASGLTIFSVGIGTATSPRNAIEIKANGEIYVYGIGNYNGTNSPGNPGYSSAVKSLQGIISSM